MILSLKSRLRYFVLALLTAVSVTHAYDFKLYTNENFHKRIDTKYFRIYYNQKTWQLANWFATKADGWAEDVHKARGFKPGIKVDVYLVHDTMMINAFSAYDKIYMYTNREPNFTQPNQGEWMEDTFKHEYGHSTVSLGAYNPFLVYSGIDHLIKYNVTALDGFLQEGSSVLLESTYGLTPGRLNSAPFVTKMLYNVDRGYKVDFWKTNNFDFNGDRYNEGAMFFSFIYQTYGEDKWRNAFNGYVNSYWNMIAYRFPEFLAKELDVDYDDLMNQYTSWLEKKSVEATPTNIVQGRPLPGQTTSVNDLLDIDDNNLYFGARDDNMLKVVAVPTKPNDMGLYKENTKLRYSAASKRGNVTSNPVIDLDASSQDGFTVYHRIATNRSVLADGLDSYYVKTTEKNKNLSNNLGNYFVDDATRNSFNMVKVGDRFFVVSANDIGQNQLHDPINNEVIFAYNQNFVIDKPRYSKERNVIYFAANKIGDTKAYVFAYNVATKQLTTLVQGMNPFMYKNDLYFVNLTGTDKALNAYKLNLNNNQVVKLTNLKYGLFQVMANDNSLFYTALNNRGDAEEYRTYKKGIYILEQDKWLNEPHNELVTAARNYNINATNNAMPTPQTVDRGKTVFPLALKLQPVDLMYTLDGDFLIHFKNQQDTIVAQAGLVSRQGPWENPQNYTNEDGDYLGGSVSDRLETVKNRFKDRYKLENKLLYLKAFYIQSGSGGSTYNSFYDFISATVVYKDKLNPFNATAIKGGKNAFNYDKVDKNILSYYVSVAPRVWDLSYGLIPTVDLYSAYNFSGNKVETTTSGTLVKGEKKNFYEVNDSVELATQVQWNDFKAKLYLGLDLNLRDHEYIYDYGLNNGAMETRLSNTSRFTVDLDLKDVLRVLPFDSVLGLDISDIDLLTEYTYGNNYYNSNPVNSVSGFYGHRLSPIYFLNPFRTSGSFGIPVSASEGNGAYEVNEGWYAFDNQSENLELTLAKEYEFKPYFGNINLGISTVSFAPFVTTTYVWNNARNKETGEKSDGSLALPYGSKEQNLFYGVTSRAELNLWKLRGSVSLAVFQKQHVLSRKGVLDNRDYKGILLNATIRY